MVTAHLNGQKEPPQRVPINLQATNKLLLGSGALSLSTGRRIPEGMHTQTLGNPSTVPIKVPQISSLHRLAGHGSTVLPQVRPKTLIPDSLPISSCRDQLSKQPPTFQKGTVVCVKNPSPALPTANNTVSHIQTQNGLSQSNDESKPISSALSSAGVAYAIISTSSSNVTPVNPSTVSLTSDGLKGQPFLTGTDSKVIIIQPQNQTHPENNVEIKQEPGRQSEETDHGVTPTKKKKEENAEKIAFMVALGLVTTEHLEEIQNKRQERKRRSTANPTYSGFLEPERKRFASNYLYNPMFLTARANEEPYWKDEITHDSYCTVCKRGSNLQPCSICPKAYHLNCVDPPLKSSPKGIWVCPKCQLKVFKKDSDVPWRGTLSIPHSYVTHKTVKEEEKRKLLKRGDELKNEHRQLQDKEQLLSGAMKKCLERKSSLLAQQKGTQSSLERLKNLIRLIQNEQMIQVTMTTTTTSSLLAVPWIKPASASAAMHQALQQSQSNN